MKVSLKLYLIILAARRERRHTHHHLQPLTSSRSRDLQVRFVSTSSSSVVSVASSSLSSEVVDTGEITLKEIKCYQCGSILGEDEIFRLKETPDLKPAEAAEAAVEDKSRPSFRSLQVEDGARRPSVTAYQLEDRDHPDVQSIQRLVSNMDFGGP